MTKGTKAIIFDLDGVIADSREVHEIAWTSVLRETGRKPSEAEIRLIHEGRKRSEMVMRFFPQSSEEEQKALGVRKDELYYANVSHLRPIPGVLEWLRKLAGLAFPLALATCAGRARTLHTLHQFGLDATFSVIVTGSDIVLGKPDPAVFLKAAELLGHSPNECLVIEDSISGVTAAKAAGIPCYLYSPGACDKNLRELRPDHIINAFTSAEFEFLVSGLRVEEALHG
jgi:HAD superfamily hydrolase (TIGR01509 family)